jgi:hypothetical protein
MYPRAIPNDRSWFNGVQTIEITNPFCDPLCYPLLFPYGEGGK